MKLVALLSLLLVASITTAQPQIDLTRFYDEGNAIGYFEDVYHCADNDYLTCGHNGGRNWVMRLDGEGNPRWTFSGENNILYAIIEADNSDAVAAGRIGDDFGIVRLSREGDIVWQRSIEGSSAKAIIELKQGDFTVAGTGRFPNALIACLRPDGEVVWQRQYHAGDNNTGSVIRAMRETDGGIVTSGYATENGHSVGWIQKVDFDGEVIWSRLHSYNDSSLAFYDMISTPEGGFAIAGASFGFVIFRVDNLGNQVVQNRIPIGAGTLQIPYGINRLVDGGFVIVGTTTNNEGLMLPIAARTDRALNVQWSNDFRGVAGPEGSSCLFEVIVLNGTTIVATGARPGPVANRQMDGWLVRLEPDIPDPIIFYRSPEDSLQTVLTGASIQFIVRARDRERNELNYRWFIGSDDLNNNDTTALIHFAEIGVDTVTCSVSNEDYSAHTDWIITVRNLFIASYSPDTLSLSLRRGTSQTFSLDTVRAVEGDPVEYQWTLINLDNFEREETSTEASATIEFLRSGNYQMEGLAYRGESSDNVIWTIAVRSAILDFWPRELNLSVLPDSLVNFGVLPFNPESDSLSYAWFLDGELIGQDSAVGWYFAPLDSQAGRSTYAVNAIVMDGAEGDTVRWEVTVQDPAEVGKWTSGQVDKWGMLSVSPNPFNSTTTIRYSTSGDAYPTRLTVHDLTGREVVRLVDERAQQSPPSRGGPYAVTLNGRDLPAGIYMLKIEAGNTRQIAKVVLLR